MRDTRPDSSFFGSIKWEYGKRIYVRVHYSVIVFSEKFGEKF